MKEFARLFTALDESNKTTAKVNALATYFQAAGPLFPHRQALATGGANSVDAPMGHRVSQHHRLDFSREL